MDILTEKEMETLLFSLGRGQKTFTTQDALDVVHWAEEIKLNNAILETVLENNLCLSVVEGEVLIQYRRDLNGTR